MIPLRYKSGVTIDETRVVESGRYFTFVGRGMMNSDGHAA